MRILSLIRIINGNGIIDYKVVTKRKMLDNKLTVDAKRAPKSGFAHF